MLVKAGGTLIVLMGLSRLGEITERLVVDGCAPATPVAVLSKGTYLIQDCRAGTLANVAGKIEGLKPPAIIVIGEVVELRNQIQWMEFAAKLES
jgi:uroporphyrinogen III methyltransferase/synthase